MAISFFASLISPHESDDNQDWFLKFCLIDFCRMAQDCTNVSFVYRSVHALSENKLATTQTDELLNDIEYNFNRPHQSVDYLAPGVCIEKEVTRIRSLVLPVWSASTC